MNIRPVTDALRLRGHNRKLISHPALPGCQRFRKEVSDVFFDPAV